MQIHHLTEVTDQLDKATTRALVRQAESERIAPGTLIVRILEEYFSEDGEPA